jgi:hypothetical protein
MRPVNERHAVEKEEGVFSVGHVITLAQFCHFGKVANQLMRDRLG